MNMKLAAIYNVWDGVELLRGSINCIKEHVDVIIIVWQEVSNYGEQYNPLPEIQEAIKDIPPQCLLIKFTPEMFAGSTNEKLKRNYGIVGARELNCTHFLHMDCDEYYSDFAGAKRKYLLSDCSGSVCKIFTYFKHATWRFENEDGYYVPFIHRLKPDTVAGVKQYPYYVDPTRRINEHDVALLDVHMHHFSWVRADIERKCRNSTARRNLERGTMLQDYHALKEPGFVRDYNQRLIEVENTFAIEF